MYGNENGIDKTKTNFLSQVYGWMTLGLTITAGASYFILAQPKLMATLFNSSIIVMVLFGLQILLAVSLSFYISRMSFFTAAAVFVAYSILTGITLSTIFLIYTQSSIALTFFVTAAMFAAMAIYGQVTKNDLSSLSSFLFMGLIGLIIAMVVNIFLKSQTFDYIISGAGVIIFALLTAVDVQQIKQLGSQLMAAGQDGAKVSILCALKLYLDFINLFLYLLRFLGQKRND